MPTQQLLNYLNTIDRPGNYYAQGHFDGNPGLNIDSIGTIALPLIPEQAQKIIVQCQQAPFGRGEQTIVDTNVRRTWELDAKHFSFNNPEWQHKMDALMLTLQAQLGLGQRQIYYSPYKLLLYETGGFFLPHRDTEKLDTMFATLVIALPSWHEGGHLFIRHDQQQVEIAFDNPTQRYNIQYTAFYADCEHEIAQVTTGYRLCLVYNLALADNKQLLAPQYSTVIQQVAVFLKVWTKAYDPSNEDQVKKLVVLLEHRYTEAGLSWDGLKNLDAVWGNVLLQAATASDCIVYLTLVELWESGAIDESIFYGGYGRRKRGRSYSDDNDIDYDELEIEEVFDETLDIKYWIDSDGIVTKLGHIAVDETEIVSNTDMRAGKPSKQEVEGPTGNAGATMDRWYYRTAIVIWPKQWHYSILAGIGQHAAVPQLAQLVSQLSTSPESYPICCQFAEAIINQWWQGKTGDFESDEPVLHQILLAQLLKLKRTDLIQRFLNTTWATAFSSQDSELLVKIAECIGWPALEQPLVTAVKQQSFNTLLIATRLLTDIAQLTQGQTEATTLLQKASVTLTQALLTCPEGSAWHWRSNKEANKSELIALCFMLFSLIDPDVTAISNVGLFKLIDYWKTDTEYFEFRRDSIPALEILVPWFKARHSDYAPFKQFLAYALARLQRYIDEPLNEPKDWVRTAKLSCTCEHCKTLATFLNNPLEKVCRFKMREELRSHIETQIKTARCDINCSTEKGKTPYTLLCTKNNASYEKRCQQHQWDLNKQATLQA